MDAPERIWARPEHDDENSYGGFWIKEPIEAGATEYIRADLVQARIAGAVKAEREACAEVANKQAAAWADSMTAFHGVPSANRIAAAIRSRGNQ